MKTYRNQSINGDDPPSKHYSITIPITAEVLSRVDDVDAHGPARAHHLATEHLEVDVSEVLILLLRERNLVHLLHVDLAHRLVTRSLCPGIDLGTAFDEP